MDTLSHEYGWTTEYILSRTFREIHYRMIAIARRRGQEAKFTASLHDKKIKGLVIPRKSEKKKEESLEDKIAEAKINEAFRQKMIKGI